MINIGLDCDNGREAAKYDAVIQPIFDATKPTYKYPYDSIILFMYLYITTVTSP